MKRGLPLVLNDKTQVQMYEFLEQENIQLKFDAKGKPVSKKVMTNDFRTNTFNETKFEFSKEGYPMMTEAVKIRRDKNGKLIRKETYEKSDVAGMFIVKYG